MRLQERLSLCAKEHALLALSGTHSSLLRRSCWCFSATPRHPKPRGSPFLQQLIRGELQLGLAELQGWAPCRSRGTGLACMLASLAVPGPALWVIFPWWQLQHEKYWMFLTELNREPFGERYLLGWRREPGWEGTSDFSGRCFIAI